MASEASEHSISAYYASANFNKEVRPLNLKSASDIEDIKEEISSADILISNFRAGKLDSLGLGDDDLIELNPKLIHGKVYGFGANSSRPAYDVVLQAESGFMLMNGEPSRPPVKMPVALIDVLAAHHLKEGLLVALLRRADSGKGSIVEVSLLDAAVSSLVNQATNWLMNKHIPQAIGSLHPNIAPYGELFSCADDKLIVLAIGSNSQFENLCENLELIELISDSRFESNADRVQNRHQLEELLKPVFKTKPREEWMSILLANSVPAGALYNLQEVFEKYPDIKILEENQEGRETLRPATIAFDIK